MKRKLWVVLSVALTVAMLVVIWQFSAQNSNETMALSGGLARKVWLWLEKVVEKWGGELSLLGVEAVLRKLAHFGVFMALGVGLTGIFIWQKRISVVLVVIVLGVICAVIDEVHQSFVPGRNPSVIDVMIDTAGVCIGMGMVLLATRKMRKNETTRESEDDFSRF